MVRHLIYILLLSVICACRDADSISPLPEIAFLGMSGNRMDQGDLNQDSLFVTFSFTDGDGDLGQGSASQLKDIFVIDQRTGILTDQFKLPEIPDSKGRPVKGDFTLRLYTTCCLFPGPIPPCSAPPQYPTDTVRFEVYLRDRAGHESNRAITPAIILNCR